MKRNIFAICDIEAEYTVNFSEYTSRKKNIPFQIQAFTSVEHLKKFAGRTPIDVLLISDRTMCSEVQELNIDRIVILSEGTISADFENYPSIYKYQSSDNVLREVMSYCDHMDGGELHNLKKQTEIISVYSPIHRCGKTTTALAIGQIMAEKRQTLYLNLEEYSGFEALTGRSYDADLSDLLYYMKNECSSFLLKLNAMIITVNGLDMIPPAGTPWDLRTMEFEDIRRLLEMIAKNSGYETVVLDIGTEFDDLFKLLDMSDVIYMPIMTDAISAYKIEQFEKLLKEWSYLQVLDRTVKIEPGNYAITGKGTSYIESLVWGEFGDYMRNILRNDIENEKISL